MSPLDRRAFLRELSVAAAGCAALPNLAAATDAFGAELIWKRAPCQLCGVGCGLLVGLENGRAVAVKGDPDSPVGQGLACVKGYHSVQALYARDRLTHARVRRNGALVDVPLDEALDLVAQKLKATAKQHGNNSVAVYGSADWSLTDEHIAQQLFERALHSSSRATDASLSSASAQAGQLSTFGLPGAVGCYDDIDQADVFIIWNQNLAESDPVLFSRLLERRRTRPDVRIIELATRSTRTSYACDRSLLYHPHTELLIANAIAQEIVSRKAHDREFTARHVAFKKGRTDLGNGLNDDRLGVPDKPAGAAWDDYVRFLAAYTPESAQQRSALAADDIRWLAALYADPARKVVSLWGSGVNQHTRGTWVNNLLYNIHLLVGKIGVPGSNPLSLASQPDGLGRQPTSALALFRAVERGDVRFLWVQGGNPLAELPNLQRYRRAVATDERFLVVSDSYPTRTTEAADVVLPAALWIEREGVSVNSERRLQHFDRLVRSPGESLGYGAQMLEVARRLGAQITGNWQDVQSAHAAPAERVPSLAELNAHAGVLWPVVRGRETRWRYAVAHDAAADKAHGEYDFYGHPDHRAWIWLRPYEPAAEPPDRAFPFWLLVGPVLEHSGSGRLTRRAPVLHRALPRAYVEINRQDAQGLGIRNGDMVRLVSRRGALTLEARIDYRGQPARGSVFVPSFDDQLLIQALTLDAACPLSGQPDPKCAVRVERVNGRSAT